MSFGCPRGFHDAEEITAIPFLIGAAVTLMTGCFPPAAGNAPSPTLTTASYRATPKADSPAAGICASFKEETIRIEIRAWPDGVPDPRCIAVRAEQKLFLLNSAPEPSVFLLGVFHGTIEPGESFAIDRTFGEYLLPGMHSMHIRPYGGPEIFFASAK